MTKSIALNKNSNISLVNELEGAKMNTTSNQVIPPNPLGNFNNLGYILKNPFAQAGLDYTNRKYEFLSSKEKNHKIISFVFNKRALQQAKTNYFSSVFNENIRFYFDVDNQYVISKLLVILFPYMYKVKNFNVTFF